MKYSAILITGFVLCVGAPTSATSADVPLLDVRPTCHPVDRSDRTVQIDTERCLATEKEARQQLVRQWMDFPAADRSLCTRTATLTSMASYVDLLTCLEMRRDVRQLPAGPTMRTAPTGMKTR